MPKKPFYLPETNEIWLSLTDASVIAISGTTYEITKIVKLAEYGNPQRGADNAAYDPSTHLFYAAVEVFSEEVTHERPTPAGVKFNGGGHQYEPGKLVVIDTETGKVVQALDSVGGADDIYYDAATGRIYFTGSTGTVAVFKEIDPDHFQLLGKVPTGAVSKTGLWVPELKRFYSAVPQHFVLTVPHGTKDFRADLLKELNLKEGEVAPILSNMIVEEAHLMVFDYLPE